MFLCSQDLDFCQCHVFTQTVFLFPVRTIFQCVSGEKEPFWWRHRFFLLEPHRPPCHHPVSGSNTAIVPLLHLTIWHPETNSFASVHLFHEWQWQKRSLEVGWENYGFKESLTGWKEYQKVVANPRIHKVPFTVDTACLIYHKFIKLLWI